MSKDRCETNLDRLLTELQTYLEANRLNASGSGSGPADRVADGIPLAHSSAGENLTKICKSGRLYSPQKLHDLGIKHLKDDAVEKELGTADFVFLYAAPFSFPSSGCGFLFSNSLERHHATTGFATPFDSGGLVKCFQRPSNEWPQDFLLRHELPVPGHRDYLRGCVGFLFEEPFHYIDGTGPNPHGPIKLAGGDDRPWKHEVRVPVEVVIRSPHLKAVFVPRRLGLVPEVRSLFSWCHSEGFDVEDFDADRENDFARLRNACVEYLRKLLN